MFGRRASLVLTAFVLTLAGRMNGQVQLTRQPASGSQPANTSGLRAEWDFQNTGSTDQTLNLTCYASGQVTSCSVYSPQPLPAYSNIPVYVTFSTGAPGGGTLRLVADCGSCAFSYDGTVGYTVLPPYQDSVTPKGKTTVQRSSNSTGFVDTFTVKNTGYYTDTYSFTCIPTGVNCTSMTPSSISNLASGNSQLVTVQYSTGSVGTGTLKLAATSTQTRDTGTISVPIVQATVSVTPHGGKTDNWPPRVTTADTFAVRNTGTGTTSFTITAACSGSAIATGCTPSTTSVSVGGGLSTNVAVSYTTGTSGSGSATLKATQTADVTVHDSGWVTVFIGTPQKPVVDVASVNPGTTRERSPCLAVAAGAAAAAECGDLRIVHALPSVRILNKVRTPTLIYNSSEARPYPLVAANLSLPSGAANPDTVYATLQTSGVVRGKAKWVGTDWSVGSARRIVVADTTVTAADTTGVYAYTLIITNWWSATAAISDTETVKVPVVNRTNSPFGAGWWLAGVERLYTRSMLWVGGDGSTRQYTSVGTQALTNCLTGQPSPGNNVYVAPSVTRVDTLKFDGGCYTRYLPHGARVTFDQQGRHIATINRLGHTTRLVYSSTGDTVLADTLPRGGVTYQFAYTPGQRWILTAPSLPGQTRADTGTITRGRLVAVRGPDTSRVSFAYFPGQDSNLVASRTDRRGFATTYQFDAGKKLTQSTLSAGVSAPIVRQWRPLETFGYPATGVTHAPDTAVAYTRFKGPRTDVGDSTLYWLSAFSAPRRIRDALGDTTLLVRGDSRWPGIVTKVVSADGRIVADSLDAHGNVVQRTDSSTVFYPNCPPPCTPGPPVYAQTSFSWDSKWDFVTMIHPPDGDRIDVAYDSTNGNRLWQQDARGSISQVTFRYNALGLLQSVTLPGIPGAQYFYYDHLGNDSAQVTPKGFTTVVLRDGIGRDTLRLRPVDSLQTVKDTDRTVYDVTDRDTFALSVGPGLSYQFTFDCCAGTKTYTTPEESVYVRKVYDPNGNLTQLWRRAGPDVNTIGWGETQFQYDAANRKTVEIAADTGTKVDSTYYDPAGNVVAVRNRESGVVTMSYDVLNRLSQRIKSAVWDSLWPSIFFSPGNYGQTLPRYYVTNGHRGWGVTVPGDTATFTYDAMGRLRTADNRDARIRRHYALNGLLTADTLIVMPWSGSDSTLHVYGLQIGYTLDGRRKWLKHPDTIAPRVNGTAQDSVAYAYAVNGQLASVTDVFGNQFRWAYDAAGRSDTLYYPGLLWEHWTYDSDSRVTERIEHDSLFFGADSGFGLHTFRDDKFLYDARGKIVQVTAAFAGPTGGPAATVQVFNAYTALGALSRSVSDTVGHENAMLEGFHPDALGRQERTWTAMIPPLPYTTDSAYNVQQLFYYRFSGALGLRQSCVQSGCPSPMQQDSILVDSTGSRLRDRTYGQGMTAGGLVGQVIVSLQTYFDGGGQVRFADRQGCDVYNNGTSYGCYAPAQIPWPQRGSFEDYRYDALGRRVLVRSRADTTCQYQHLCQSTIQRTVWDGNQILYEVRYPGADIVSSSALEWDTVFVAVDSAPYGRVVYTHGLAIDQPLEAIRIGYSVTWPGPVATVLHANWRGLIDMGTFANGASTHCVKNASGTDSTGLRTCVSPDPAAGLQHAYFHDPYESVHAPLAWFGNIISLKRDASGQFYMRNRYYDPNTGVFTQEDPLGFGGGLSLYGFAGGDPVNFSDPFGLCPFTGKKRTENVDDCPQNGLGSAFRLLRRDGGSLGRAVIHDVASKQLRITVTSEQTVHTVCQNTTTNGCTVGHTITMVNASPGDMATRLTHEDTHVDNPAPYPQQEVHAWNRALDLFDGLRGNASHSAFYGPPSAARHQDPAAFDQAVCTAAGGPPC